jgi:hypothetical protein
VAISYVWGEEPPRRTIYLNGDKFRLRENIYEAIRAVLRLRTLYRSGDQVPNGTPQVLDLQKMLAECEFFWIDSICIWQTCIEEQTQQVGLMDKIFSHAQFVVSWLGPSSKGSIEVMQSIRSYVPPSEQVDFSMSHILFPEDLKRAIKVFEDQNYWSRSWIIQEILLAKDVLVLLGEESLSWNKLKDLILGCALFLGAPLKTATPEHANQDTLEQMASWMRIVLLREQRNFALENQQVPHGASNDDGDDERSRTLPSLYSLVFSCSQHSCTKPRDRVISLLGLVPGTSRLINYSTPIDQYFEEVCEHAFAEAHITESGARSSFRSRLGYSLQLPEYPDITGPEIPSLPRYLLNYKQFLAFRTTSIPYQLPRDIKVLSELIYFNSDFGGDRMFSKFY